MRDAPIPFGPHQPVIIVRLMPAVYVSVDYPPGLSLEEICEFAAELGRRRRKRVCVVVSPQESVYIELDGSREVLPTAPSIRVGGEEFSHFEFDVRWGDG